MEITRDIFDQQRAPRFGTANPERMNLPFWEWMIRGGEEVSSNAKKGLKGRGLVMRDGKLKSSFGPYRARDLFDIPLNREEGPIWTFDRMGATQNRLPDGRIICVGGEHEDFYDPDFCIYNDVVVLGPYDEIEIYGYPKEVFPPTDFHTATFTGEQIVIVGGLGYKNERRPGHTPVFRLDLSRYSIDEITTSGEMPGWISKHEARYDPEGFITISGGQVVKERGGIARNFDDYALDITSWKWQRLTNRNWHEFSIRQEKGMFLNEKRPKIEALLPRDIPHASMPRDDDDSAHLLVDGVPVSVSIDIMEIRILIKGSLPDASRARLLEEIRGNAEAATNGHCVLKAL